MMFYLLELIFHLIIYYAYIFSSFFIYTSEDINALKIILVQFIVVVNDIKTELSNKWILID